MRALKVLRAHPSSTLLLNSLASLNPKPNPNPNLNKEAFDAQKARPLLLHRSYSPASNPNPDLGNEAPANLSSQRDLEVSMDLSDCAFDHPGAVPWRKELCGRTELIGKLREDVSLFCSASGFPIASSSLKFSEGNICLSLVFFGDRALVAAAYLAKHDCILVSGRLVGSFVEPSNWVIKVTDFKYVQTEHHNGRIPKGFVREPQMEKLSDEGVHIRWREFFNEPSQWWDNRANSGLKEWVPDFVHKTLGYGLRVCDCRVPIWVKERLRLFDASRDAQVNDDDGNACKEGDTSCQHH